MTTLYQQMVSSALAIEAGKITEYPDSHVQVDQDQLILCKIEDTKKILAVGSGTVCCRLSGDGLSQEMKLCPLTHQNRLILNEFLPYTNPSAFGRQTATFGLGDRLGIASPGHIRCFLNSSAKPIMAQQSKRELDLTGRTYEQVLDDVCFAVFQEGYKGGFGADGDHLKRIEDIEEALECGYTMITLDCTEKIGKGIEALAPEKKIELYKALSADYRKRIEDSYLNKSVTIAGETYHFATDDLIDCALIYHSAVDFVAEVYFNCLKKANHNVDFELSIDETESITTAQGHLFVAMELEYNRVEVTSLAPRFIGEFQKGIDYLGNLGEFEIQLRQHASIADHFGYKLSIHSGSDKFSVFPLIGKYTEGRLHIKTSGTNWLEAVGVAAEKNPMLYRRVHKKALEHFQEAKKHYYVSGDPNKVENPDSRSDEGLADYLIDDNSRQLLHITYGYVLDDPELRAELYHTLEQNEEHYYKRLITHIGRHLTLTGLSE